MGLPVRPMRIGSGCLACRRSLTLPLRRLAAQQQQQQQRQQQHRPFTQTTTLSAAQNDAPDAKSTTNPVLEEYRRRSAAQTQQRQAQATPAPGDIAATSIFEDDRRAQQQAARDAGIDAPASASESSSSSSDGKVDTGGLRRDPRNMARVLDPNPGARERWERKKVIQMVRRGARLSNAQFIKRTEREHLVKSHNMKTSVKKLGMLARQIAGKGIEEAMTQMRFSKKKVAREVGRQLEFARDEAVVVRGMGLGGVDVGEQAEEKEGASNLNSTSPAVSGTSTPEAEAKPANSDHPFDIQLKSGKRHTITSPTKIYIDQAWVGRGPYGHLPDYRAKGRLFIMRTPFTSLSLLLKEEKTRVREYEEREAKRRRQRIGKVWTPLPDRPIVGQRQWYSW